MQRIISLHTLSIIAATTALIGLAIHDSRADAVVVLSAPAVAAFEGLHLLSSNTTAHTHVERVSISRVAGRFTMLDPQQRARLRDTLRYKTHKLSRRGRIPFDDILLPITTT